MAFRAFEVQALRQGILYLILARGRTARLDAHSGADKSWRFYPPCVWKEIRQPTVVRLKSGRRKPRGPLCQAALAVGLGR